MPHNITPSDAIMVITVLQQTSERQYEKFWAKY